MTIFILTRTSMVSLALLFFLNSTAWAGKIFNWNNEIGHTSFTDYRSSIPLKFRNQIKDEVEPPKFVAPSTTMKTEATTETTTQQTTQEGENKEGQAKAGEEKEEKGNDMSMDEEMAKLMIETVDMLIEDFLAFKRFLKAAKFNEEEGRFFVMLTRQSEKRKQTLLPKLEEVKSKALVDVRNYLMDSLEADKEVDFGRGPQYVRMLQDLESRIKQEQEQKASMEKALKKELSAGGVTDEIARELGAKNFAFAQEEDKEGS